MMDEAGIPVARLRRVRIGPRSLAGLPLGTDRELTPGEIGSLLESLRLQEAEPDREAGQRSNRPRPTETSHRHRVRPAATPNSETRDANDRPAARSKRDAARPPKTKQSNQGEAGGETPANPSDRRQPREGGSSPRRNERSRRDERRPYGPKGQTKFPERTGAGDERPARRNPPVRGPVDDASRTIETPRQSGKPRSPKRRAAPPSARKATTPNHAARTRRRADDDRS
jgi:hypothetical protein